MGARNKETTKAHDQHPTKEEQGVVWQSPQPSSPMSSHMEAGTVAGTELEVRSSHIAGILKTCALKKEETQKSTFQGASAQSSEKEK